MRLVQQDKHQVDQLETLQSQLGTVFSAPVDKTQHAVQTTRQRSDHGRIFDVLKPIRRLWVNAAVCMLKNENRKWL